MAAPLRASTKSTRFETMQVCMVSRDIRRAARCAHNAPNTGKRAFGPLPRGVHAAAADSKGRGLKAPSRIPESGGNANLAHSSGMKKSSEPLSEPSSGR